MERSASMNSRSARELVSAKTMRAVCTQLTSAITIATIHRLGDSTAARQIARSSAGNAIIRSVKRIRTAPIQPRKKPAVTPTRVPMISATPLATMPMIRDVRAP